MTTIFIIEKSKNSLQGAASALMGDFAVRAFASLAMFKTLAKWSGHSCPDIIIVDLDDPEMLSLKSTECILEIFPHTALIFMHAKELTEDYECVFGLKQQKIFFFQKPIDSLRLSLFVSRVAKSIGKKTNILRIGDFIFDFDRLICRTLPDENAVNLPLKEAQILKLMMERWGECLSRADFHRILWPNIKVSPRTIDSHISRLRKRLNALNVTISSKYGDGYVLDVSPLPSKF